MRRAEPAGDWTIEEVRRGMVLCASDAVAPVTMAEGELRILDSVKGKVEDFLEAHLHVGTASVLARVAMLEETEMAAGQKQMVQLRLAEPLPLVPGDRFVRPRQSAGAGPDRPGHHRRRAHSRGQQCPAAPEEALDLELPGGAPGCAG